MWDSLPALKTELEEFESKLQKQFHSKKANSYLDKLALDIIESGGKRLRPAMTIASAMLGEYNQEKAINAALSIELLHTATLVHDDIIDNALLRRGTPTVFAREGVSTAVFTGDYLLVKAVLALTNANLPLEYLKKVAEAIEAVCIGEVEQFRGRGKLIGFKTYLSRIVRKTGVLFASSCVIGSHLGGLSEEKIKSAARFGHYYGIAFQIKDDLLDVMENESSIGKPVGHDLKEGIVTLPVLLAAAKDKAIEKHVASYLKKFGKRHNSKKEITNILKSVVASGGVDDSYDILNRYIDKAQNSLDKLPISQGRDMLQYILDTTFN